MSDMAMMYHHKIPRRIQILQNYFYFPDEIYYPVLGLHCLLFLKYLPSDFHSFQAFWIKNILQMILSVLVVHLFFNRDLKLISFLRLFYQIFFSTKLDSFRKIFSKCLKKFFLNWFLDRRPVASHDLLFRTVTNHYSFLLLN